MKKKLLYLSMLMIAILAACGPAPAPTMSAEEIQGTAVAAAWTVVALTEVSIPTVTLLPPTQAPSPTPLPTFTPLPPPTSSFPTAAIGAVPTSPPNVVGGPTSDPCNAPIASDAAGAKANVNFYNKSSGTAITSLYLSKTAFGECGIYSFTFQPGSNVVSILAGCYWAGAFITGSKHESKAFGSFCLTGDAHKYDVSISNETIGF